MIPISWILHITHRVKISDGTRINTSLFDGTGLTTNSVIIWWGSFTRSSWFRQPCNFHFDFESMWNFVTFIEPFSFKHFIRRSHGLNQWFSRFPINNNIWNPFSNIWNAHTIDFAKSSKIEDYFSIFVCSCSWTSLLLDMDLHFALGIPNLQPHSSTLDENVLKYNRTSKRFRSRPLLWGVKHFCSKNWS